ncbi:hypothetical protein AGMMS50256_35380 [Betaproteobacteria bacterium]|nr:hypothetical protein AGMMS50256_35380 [Betaproteobacteria bacterium]
MKKVPALHRHLSRIATNTDIDHNISENTSQLSTAEIINTRILQLTTYDIETPNHGGKIRAHQIRRSLRSKFHVETLSFEWSQKDDASSFSVQLNTSRYITEVGNGLLSDWGICQYLDTYPDITEKIFAKIKNYCPDILFVEQPFLWSFVENLIRSGAVPADIFIVYSSHNIESDLKRKIYFDNFQEQDAIRYLDYVDSIEKAIISRSDVVLAVSETDAAYIKEFNRDVPIRVYANGHSRPRLFGAKTEWIKKFRAGGAGPNWVFVGSYHPPNINGLRDFLAAIPPDFDTDKFALWVLGGAGDGLKAMPGFDPLAYPCLHIAGPVSDEDIDSAINTATGILLPIWEGSGSNLKTAQALLSGKCVVATRYAFRGFEHYLNEPGVFTADRAVDLVNLAMTPHLETEYIRERASVELSWDNVLETLPIFTSKHFDNYRIGKNQDCKIVFDCTSIIEWKGQLTGIQRVIVQLGTNLCNLSHYIKLGVFDSHGNCSRYSLADRTIGTQMNIEAGDIILSAGPNWDSMDHHQCLLALRHKGIRLGILYYDTIPYILPLSYGPGFATIYTKWLDDSLRNCDIAFAISENTKRDLISFCSEQKICPPPVSVVRLGDQIEMAGNVTPSELIKEITALPFILSVGTIEYRKNHIVLLNAYRYMLRDQSYKPPKLLIVGRKGWLDSEIAYQVENDPCLKDHIVILQGITDIDLGYLYSNCLFTVYPSIYEGWGLPIAESLNFGKLCIASRSSSMLEIAFDLTRHAHPLLVHEWVNEIRDLLDHPEVLERESERIGREYEPCSWRRSAEQIHAGLCQVFSWLNKE